MTRNLFIIAGASLVLSLACLGGAAALGGHDLAEHGWTWVISDSEPGARDNVHIQRGDLGPTVTRTLAWDGDKSLTVDMSADVTYVQGDTAGVQVTGPKSAAERVRIVDGRIILDDEDDYAERVVIRVGPTGIHGEGETERLKIVVTAPSVNSFRVAGSGDLTIERYHQPSLEVVIDGSGDVEATGEAASVTIRNNASGDADLAGLDVGDADIENAGSGEIEIGPRGKARVEISGSGDVRLTRKPASVEQSLTGSGDLEGI
jgi:hypothetical protein